MRFPGLGVRVAVEALAPIVPVPAEGRVQLLYELRLTSFDARALRLESLEVLGAPPDGPTLARFGAAELEAMVLSSSSTAERRLELVPGALLVLCLWVDLAPGLEAPRAVHHRADFDGETGTGPGRLSLDAGACEVSREVPLVVDPPLVGGPWYAHAGPAAATHHRSVLAPRDGVLTIDSRFATDWVRLGASDASSDGAPLLPAWDSTAGSEVRAVASGIVVAVVDDLPDDPDLDPEHASPQAEAYRRWIRRPFAIDWDTIGGNRVTVDMGSRRFAWYEHLRQGSVRVRVGDRVERGQLLGLVGSSGNAGAPHLHFEITDSPVKGKGDGLPYVFRHFELLARVTPLPGWDELVSLGREHGAWSLEHHRHGLPDELARDSEIPLGGAIVRFPGPSPVRD